MKKIKLFCDSSVNPQSKIGFAAYMSFETYDDNLEIKTKMLKVFIEGIQVKKQDGSKVNVKLQPSNLQIIELNTEDKKRLKRISVQKAGHSDTQSLKIKTNTLKIKCR